MEKKKCLWCDRVFEWERGAYCFCDPCIYKMGLLQGATHRKPVEPIACLEQVLLSAENSKHD